MRRTTYGRRRWRTIGRVVYQNRRLLLYLTLWFIGVVLGLLTREDLLSRLQPIVALKSIEPSFANGVSQAFASCFLPICLLLLLFLAGLSACGAPVTALVPIFYGLGLGLTQAYWGAKGGQGALLSAVWIWPHSLIETVALLMGCCESLRLSLQMASQLLPGGRIGGLWSDFKLYLLRFAVFCLLAISAGVIDVLLRMFLPLAGG